MFQKANGEWKSDFRINGTRYQRGWDTTDRKVAEKKEKEWKKELRESKGESLSVDIPKSLDWMMDTTPYQEPMLLSEVRDWMVERKWQFLEDAKNPPSRMNNIIGILGDKNILDVTTEDIEKLRSVMLQRGNSNALINHYLSTLKTSIDLLEAKKRLVFKERPSFSGMRMKTDNSRIVNLKDEELVNMLTSLKKRYARTLYIRDWEMIEYFIINSSLGLRPAEYYEIQVGDIDFEQNTITIERARKQNKDGSISVGPTKNGVKRTLPINGIARETLKNMVERVKLAKETTLVEARKLYLTSSEGTPKELFWWIAKGHFEWLRGTPLERIPLNRLTQKICEKSWRRMLDDIGYTDRVLYKDYTQYALRHTVASKLAGVRKFGAHKIMLFMGHKNIQTSLKYVHLNVDDIRDGAGVGISMF